YGEPTLDLREVEANRFHPHAPSKAYVKARGERQYIEVYDVIHQLQQMENPRGLRVAPYHQRLKDLGAVFFESAGWEKPQWFESNEILLGDHNGSPVRAGWAARYWSPIIGAEHEAARERVGLFDLTNFTKVEVTGPGALAFLQKLTANQLDKPVGSIVYTSLLTPRGGIKADLTITRLGEERFWVVTGGGSGLLDLAWLKFHAPRDGSVHIQNVSSAYAAIGVWGPRARDLAQAVCEDDLSNEAFPYVTAQNIFVEHIPVTALRISYAGELGWEMYTPTEYGLKLWDTLWAAGQPFDVAAVGGGAFDSLRLEKGYRLWGSEIHTEYNPLEAGLGFAVRMKKGDFVGREALERIKAEGLKRKLCAMTFDDPSVAIMGKEPIFAPGTESVLGYVT
ncbi:MAG: sarcosine dehydrogenase, partial [Anaerolineales bacterium]